jgi:ketosteroid isomerase-like protein
MKSTSDVLDDHLTAIRQGDVNAVLSDYASDAVLFREDGVFKGVDAIRSVLEKIRRRVSETRNNIPHEAAVGRGRLRLYGVDGRDRRQRLRISYRYVCR